MSRHAVVFTTTLRPTRVWSLEDHNRSQFFRRGSFGKKLSRKRSYFSKLIPFIFTGPNKKLKWVFVVKACRGGIYWPSENKLHLSKFTNSPEESLKMLRILCDPCKESRLSSIIKVVSSAHWHGYWLLWLNCPWRFCYSWYTVKEFQYIV